MALNNAWANATLYGVLNDLDVATFTAPRPGFFPSISRTMNHIYEVDLFYLDALTVGSRGRAVFKREDVTVPAELAALQADADMKIAMFCHEISPDDLTQPRKTERRDHVPEESVEAVLLHLFQHQTHHRGQAHVQVQDAGISPPQLDEFHLDFDRAESARAYFQ
jgi:uncharacterized damage-inducible protein DinB